MDRNQMISCDWSGRIMLEVIDTIFLILIGVSIIMYWVFWIAKGGLKDGIRTMEYGTYITPHIAAEFVTAALCIASGIAIFWASSGV